MERHAVRYAQKAVSRTTVKDNSYKITMNWPSHKHVIRSKLEAILMVNMISFGCQSFCHVSASPTWYFSRRCYRSTLDIISAKYFFQIPLTCVVASAAQMTPPVGRHHSFGTYPIWKWQEFAKFSSWSHHIQERVHRTQRHTICAKVSSTSTSLRCHWYLLRRQLSGQVARGRWAAARLYHTFGRQTLGTIHWRPETATKNGNMARQKCLFNGLFWAQYKLQAYTAVEL